MSGDLHQRPRALVTQESRCPAVCWCVAPFLPEVHGFCEPRFAPVRDAFLQHFRDGLECGASVAVWLDGGWVVDLWAGWQDAKRQKPWQRDTLVNVLSATKGLAAACMMQQVERGLLDLDAPVSEYWPEFSQGGKSAARVRHFLTHESGAIGIRAPLSVEEMYDHDHMAALLAREEAFWEPGTESNYHVRSYGWLNEELLRRVTGNRGDTLIRQDIVEPLEIDFLLGFGGECDARVAELSTGAGMAPAVRARLMQDELVRAALLNPTLPPDEFNSRRWRSTPLLASNGHCNARASALLRMLSQRW